MVVSIYGLFLRAREKNLKKLDLRGASRPPSILIRRRPSNAGRETLRTPALSDLGSGTISWNLGSHARSSVNTQTNTLDTTYCALGVR